MNVEKHESQKFGVGTIVLGGMPMTIRKAVQRLMLAYAEHVKDFDYIGNQDRAPGEVRFFQFCAVSSTTRRRTLATYGRSWMQVGTRAVNIMM